MNFSQLFSFEGRQRRLHFWIVAIVLMIINSIVFNVTLGPVYVAMLTGTGSPAAVFGGLGLIGWLVSLILLWPALANSVKRCHDRNKSGWWLLLMWLASFTIIGALWPLIELGFLDGTPGPNRFGASPKGIAGPTPTIAAAA
jgi:uncharacterized membrane protein YhaH (DUF805 family)